MTVCVAAICETNSMLGASDRMLTSGDVEFEPEQQKIYQQTSSVAIMVAGDASVQSQIVRQVNSIVRQRVESEPTNWWLVEDVAQLYSRYYSELKLRRAETAILAPLGLNRQTFIDKQQQMAPTLVNQLAQQMINFPMPAAEAIIAGIDPTGAHIYIADGSDLSCEDTVGFAAIGIGRWHANSQFMFAGHTRFRTLAQTAYVMFSAKRRAEVAPGVGTGTDMFLISGLGQYTQVGDHVLKALDTEYTRNQKGINKSSKKAENSFAAYIEHLGEAQPTPEQKASGTSERPPETGPTPETGKPENEAAQTRN